MFRAEDEYIDIRKLRVVCYMLIKVILPQDVYRFPDIALHFKIEISSQQVHLYGCIYHLCDHVRKK